MERLQALEEEEGVEGREARAQVPKQLHPELEPVRHVAHAGEVPERVPVNEAVVAGIGLGEAGELAVAPVEGAAIDDGAPDRRAVAADVLGQ